MMMQKNEKTAEEIEEEEEHKKQLENNQFIKAQLSMNEIEENSSEYNLEADKAKEVEAVKPKKVASKVSKVVSKTNIGKMKQALKHKLGNKELI
jgi:hypothetical protein